MEISTYYRDQLKAVEPGRAGTDAAKIKITHKTSNTQWMDLNAESATELYQWLQTHYKIRPQNTHVLKIIRLGWTETKPERIKIYSERFKQSVTFSRDSHAAYKDNLEEATAYLQAAGFNILSYGEGPPNQAYIISDTFKPLKP